MKITRERPYTRPLVSLTSFTGGAGDAPSGQVPTSVGSNGQVAWGSNVSHIYANGSNHVLGPLVNFAAGTGITLSVSSNTMTITGTGGGSSGVTVADEGTPLSTAGTTLDFVGAGVTASGSGATKTITIPGGGSGSSGYDLDTYTLDGTYGDDFTAGSLDAAWTRRNYAGGDETYQVGKNATYLRIAKAGQSAGDGYFRSATSLPDGTYAAAFVARQFGASTTNLAWGIAVIDSSGSGIATCIYHTPSAPLLIQVTTYSTYGGSYVQVGASGSSPNVSVMPTMTWKDRKVWVYIRKSGTNWYTAFSLDGEVWSPESSALSWSGTIDRIGFMDAPLGAITSGSGTGAFVDVDWFNKIA